MVEETQGAGTSTASTIDGATANTTAENQTNVVENQVYKTFKTQEEFDNHSAGIYNNAKKKAEKEILSELGLTLDQKDKLSQFKAAYDATLSESEKQAKSIETLNLEVSALQAQVEEKDAVIVALTRMTGSETTDVAKYVKMAKGLVDDKTTMEMALAQVMDFVKPSESEKKPVPVSQPLFNNSNNNGNDAGENPFKGDNLTEQGRIISIDRPKAREYYYQAYGKYPSW